MENKENREFSRRSLSVDIDAVIGNRVIQARTKDISSTGLYIAAQGKFKVGEPARVVFAIPGCNGAKPFKLYGKTIWTDQKGVAIQFEQVTPLFLSVLDEALWGISEE